MSNKIIFKKYKINTFNILRNTKYYSTSNKDDLFEIKNDEKKYNWINELNDQNNGGNKKIKNSNNNFLPFKKKSKNEWEAVSNKIKNKTLEEITKTQKSVITDEHEKWQKTLIHSMEKHQEDGRDLKRVDKLLTIKNALRPDLVDQEYYHNPGHIGELMSEERKREWRNLKSQRIDAEKLLNDLKTHLMRGERLPEDLTKKAEEILKKPVFEELKNRGLLHEQYLDISSQNIDQLEDYQFGENKAEEEVDRPTIINPDQLDSKMKPIKDDFFALEDSTINNPKKNCEFCFCKGIMPELHPLNVHLLLHFMTPGGRILSRQHTGLCAKWQRKVSTTIRRAKNLGIFSYNKSKYYINFPFENPTTTEYLNQKYQKLIPFKDEQEELMYKTVSEDEKVDLYDKIASDEDINKLSPGEKILREMTVGTDKKRRYRKVDQFKDDVEEDFADSDVMINREEDGVVEEQPTDDYVRSNDSTIKSRPRRRSSLELDQQRSNNYNLILDKLDK